MTLLADRIDWLFGKGTPAGRAAADPDRALTLDAPTSPRLPAVRVSRRLPRITQSLPVLYLAAVLLVIGWMLSIAARWLLGAMTGDWQRWSVEW